MQEGTLLEQRTHSRIPTLNNSIGLQLQVNSSSKVPVCSHMAMQKGTLLGLEAHSRILVLNNSIGLQQLASKECRLTTMQEGQRPQRRILILEWKGMIQKNPTYRKTNLS